MTYSVGAIVLAAGTSSRMGRMKQLLPLKGRPLLRHVIDKVLKEEFSEVVTVIGFQAEKIKEEIQIIDERFRWIVNENYLSGQSSSLKSGVVSLNEKTAGMMVFLGDLPFCSQETIHEIYQTGYELLKTHPTSFVVQPVLYGKAGHPVFFGHVNKNFFNKLEGDRGAKIIMKQIPYHKRISVTDEGILFDIDTPVEYLNAENLK